MELAMTNDLTTVRGELAEMLETARARSLEMLRDALALDDPGSLHEALVAAGDELVAAHGDDAAMVAEAAMWDVPTVRLHELVAWLLVRLVDERGSHAMTVSSMEGMVDGLVNAQSRVEQLQRELDGLRERPDVERLAAVIADPAPLAGPRRHPSWGPGHAYYAEDSETPAEWAARAVAALLTGQQSPPPSTQLWLIWSNQHRMWWGPRHCGYTPQIEEAGRYTEAEARDAVAEATCDWQLSDEGRDPITGSPYVSYDEVMVRCPAGLGEPVDRG